MDLKNQICLGAGQVSLAQIGRLYQQLSRAIDIIGGIQQPPMSTDPPGSHDEHMEAILSDKLELDRIAKEIFLGLTGKKVKIAE